MLVFVSGARTCILNCAIAVSGAELADEGATTHGSDPMRSGNYTSDHFARSSAPIAWPTAFTMLVGASLVFAFVVRGPQVASGELKLAPAAMIAGAPMPSTFASSDRPARTALVSYLSRRYRIAGEAAAMLVDITYETGDEIGVDPLLILAVMAIESRFNPIAESDSGAKGLMQVIPRYHLARSGGNDPAHAALTPAVNIQLGSRVLKEYIDSTGSVEAGLQKYNGALWDGSSLYAQKILAERSRYLQVVREQLTSQRRESPRVPSSGGRSVASGVPTRDKTVALSSESGS
jgi:soluble lytic murein transglycosylase-like protein